MWLKKLSAFFIFLPSLVLSQSDFSRSVSNLIDDEKYDLALKRADSLLETPSFKDDYFYLYSKKGDAYYYKGDARQSLKNYLLALEQPEIRQFENREALHEATSYAGSVYSDLGLYERSLEYSQKSLNLAVEMGDSLEVATAHFNIATALMKQENLSEGIDELQKAYEIDKLRKDTAAIGFDLNALGFAELIFNNPEKAILYFKESIVFLQNGGNYNSLGTRYNNLSKAFTQKQQWDSALFYNKLSIDIHDQYNDEINLAERWINRAFILNEMKLPKQSLEWGLKAQEKVKSLSKSELITKSNHVLINSYSQLNDLSKALTLSSKNLEMTKSGRDVGEYQIALKDHADLLSKTGQAQKALENFKLAAQLLDSIRSIETRKITSQLEMQYDVDKMESENEILRLQSEVVSADLARKRVANKWLIAVIIVVLVAGMTTTILLISKNKVKEQLLQTEINQLRLQIKDLMDFDPSKSKISIDHLNKVLNDPLSDREFEVLTMAMSEKSNSQIAESIFISTNTVKYHLKNIYNKLGVSNRREALKFAFQTIQP